MVVDSLYLRSLIGANTMNPRPGAAFWLTVALTIPGCVSLFFEALVAATSVGRQGVLDGRYGYDIGGWLLLWMLGGLVLILPALLVTVHSTWRRRETLKRRRVMWTLVALSGLAWWLVAYTWSGEFS